jgi:hypothetical protein
MVYLLEWLEQLEWEEDIDHKLLSKHLKELEPLQLELNKFCFLVSKINKNKLQEI